jgi:hypothetical protein
MLSFSVPPGYAGANGRHRRSLDPLWRGSTPFLKATATSCGVGDRRHQPGRGC